MTVMSHDIYIYDFVDTLAQKKLNGRYFTFIVS